MVSKKIKKINSKKAVQKEKVLAKSKNKLVFGVISGIAEYFNQDPTLIRLIFIVLAVATGFIPAVILYILAVLIMPKQSF